MEPIRTPFRYDVHRFTGSDDECPFQTEAFLPARMNAGDPSRPFHFNKNVFFGRTEDGGFVVSLQTATTAYHMYEGFEFEPGTYVFTPIAIEFECICR